MYHVFTKKWEIWVYTQKSESFINQSEKPPIISKKKIPRKNNNNFVLLQEGDTL